MVERNAVVLLSGGLDSTTAAAIARSQGFALHALTFDYGQRHRIEIARAGAVAKQLGVAEWISLGAIPAAVPHTRPVPILVSHLLVIRQIAVGSDDARAEHLRQRRLPSRAAAGNLRSLYRGRAGSSRSSSEWIGSPMRFLR